MSSLAFFLSRSRDEVSTFHPIQNLIFRFNRVCKCSECDVCHVVFPPSADHHHHITQTSTSPLVLRHTFHSHQPTPQQIKNAATLHRRPFRRRGREPPRPAPKPSNPLPLPTSSPLSSPIRMPRLREQRPLTLPRGGIQSRPSHTIACCTIEY